MGYCHVAQPIYLTAGDVHEDAMVSASNKRSEYIYSAWSNYSKYLLQQNIELLGDGYEGDVIGESTPDALVNEFVSFRDHGYHDADRR